MQHIIRRETEEWIALHFPQVFTDLHFGNHYSGTWDICITYMCVCVCVCVYV
jgi:hypothetical protein